MEADDEVPMEYTDEAADGEEGQENEVVEELDAEEDAAAENGDFEEELGEEPCQEELGEEAVTEEVVKSKSRSPMLFEIDGGKFVVRLRQKLRNADSAEQFCEELVAQIEEKRAVGEVLVFEDFDISQNPISFEHLEGIFNALTDSSVQVERLRAFGVPTLDDMAASLLAGWLHEVTQETAPFELHLSDCAITEVGFRAIMEALSDNATFPAPDPKNPSRGLLPLYCRVEGNYIDVAALKETVDSGIATTMKKNSRTDGFSESTKCRLLVREDGTFQQRRGSPPAPEDAPPPRAVSVKGKGGKDKGKGGKDGKNGKGGKSGKDSREGKGGKTRESNGKGSSPWRDSSSQSSGRFQGESNRDHSSRSGDRDGKGESKGYRKGESKGDRKGESKGDRKGESKGDRKGDGKGDRKGDGKGDRKGDGKGDRKGDSYGDRKGDRKGDGKGDRKGDGKGDGKGDSKGSSRRVTLQPPWQAQPSSQPSKPSSGPRGPEGQRGRPFPFNESDGERRRGYDGSKGGKSGKGLSLSSRTPYDAFSSRGGGFSGSRDGYPEDDRRQQEKRPHDSRSRQEQAPAEKRQRTSPSFGSSKGSSKGGSKDGPKGAHRSSGESLPRNWEKHFSEQYKLHYFWNSETGSSSWDRPSV
ncbi:unnamed protein product [Polarella glacialis]|uniref:WW domain-containing protein n=1 Tax=Polarella glacialis TaxID=89957 RepID=A0A813GQR7_POLGL|nr:unnamed protein product [Polarella glacialis]